MFSCQMAGLSTDICEPKRPHMWRSLACDLMAWWWPLRSTSKGRAALKVPAGIMELGEDALTAAQHELMEETGYEAEDFRLLAITHDDDNRGMSVGHHFLPQGCAR